MNVEKKSQNKWNNYNKSLAKKWIFKEKKDMPCHRAQKKELSLILLKSIFCSDSEDLILSSKSDTP